MRLPRPSRILLTNVGIANRTGTEIMAMDLARGLAAAGHAPMIWAPLVDPDVVAPVVASGIPVVSRFEDLPCAPDVIHGHHHLETIEALRRFPRVPALFVCHSGYWWHDDPPRHPRIVRYVAVDDFCRERLASAAWVDPDRIATVRNAVDLNRYQPRPPLPTRPRRALIFSHYAGPDTHVEPVREACERAGIELETMGSGTGTPSATPERVLQEVDLVFGKARCALEAMATGCAVVLCDTTGLGSMVTHANVAELQRWNFGFRTLQRPLMPELIAAEIERYDSQDARDVRDYVRGSAPIERAVNQYIALYRAIAAAPLPEDDSVDWHPATVPLQIGDQAALRLRFIEVPPSAAPRQHFRFDVGVFNGSRRPVATAAPWPSMLMCRWLDGRTGQFVVEHGFRTILQPPAWPDTETVYSMRAFAPGRAGEYVLRVTIIQEGWRWLDHLDPRVLAETRVVVLG
jgi:glycosyltransferase involved in cell wall biosynthesis